MGVLMEKIFVAQRVANQLWTTEAALDAALVEATTLMRDVIQARADLKVSSVFADQINVKLMEAMQAMTEARTAMVGVHDELNDAKLRLGLRTKMELLKPAHLATETEVTLRKAG
jgi:hypothetical protein